MKTRDELIDFTIKTFDEAPGGKRESLIAVIDAIAPELLGPPTNEESRTKSCLAQAFERRLDGISKPKPKTPEERVTVELYCDRIWAKIFLDGVLECHVVAKAAEWVRRGLIEELKEAQKQPQDSRGK